MNFEKELGKLNVKVRNLEINQENRMKHEKESKAFSLGVFTTIGFGVALFIFYMAIWG